jgi:dTDP-4-amino-4,6-dideoxygalactose transaminase
MASPSANKRQLQHLPYSVPSIGAEEKQELLAALNSGWITTGPRAKDFERCFAAYVGAKEAVGVSSCTAALHLALAALRVGPQDAVVTTPFTFASTANVIVHQGAYPVFVDIDPDTYNLDPQKLEFWLRKYCIWDGQNRALRLATNGRFVRVLIAVHYGGNPCDMVSIERIAERFSLSVIEDAAHAAGAEYRGRKVGTAATAACFSFYANKNMTTAEGGMLTTNDSEMAERVRLLSSHGISRDSWARYGTNGSWRYDLTEPGFKYNLPDTAAALGLHQLRKLDAFNARRSELVELYNEALRSSPYLKLPRSSDGCKSAWHLYAIQITHPAVTRDDIMEQLRRNDIGSSVHFIPLHLMSYYQHTFGYRRGDFPVAEQVFDRILSLPLYPGMEDADVSRVALTVLDALTRSSGSSVIPAA